MKLRGSAFAANVSTGVAEGGESTTRAGCDRLRLHAVDALRMTVPMLAGSIATGRPATAPSHAVATSDSSHTAIQPQTTTDAIVTRTPSAPRRDPARWSGGGAGSPTACSRSRPLSRDRTRCPRCPASRGTTRRRHRQAVVARVPRRARPAPLLPLEGVPEAGLSLMAAVLPTGNRDHAESKEKEGWH